MRVTAELDLNFTEASKRQIFHALMFEKFGFDKHYFIEGDFVYEMRPDGVSERPHVVREATDADIHIFALIQHLNKQWK